MSILKPALGHRYEIALQRTLPTECNRYGKQFMYSLAEPRDHVIYVPPFAHAEIQSLHVEPGELFSVRKSIGPDNEHVWEVERVQIETPATTPQHKPMTAAHAITAPPVADIPVPPSLTTPQSVALFQQLCAVLLAVRAAEDFGKSIGREVHFESADIRAMSISGFIDGQASRSRRVA